MTSSRPAVLDPPLRTHQKRAADSHDQPPPPPQRIDKHVITYDNAEDDGPPYSENRRGKRLCPGFNGDGCDKALKDGACPKHKNTVHQCSWCRRADHGMQKCPVHLAIRKKGKGTGGRGGGRGGGKRKR